jgi:hypothetical protein
MPKKEGKNIFTQTNFQTKTSTFLVNLHTTLLQYEAAAM